MDSPLSVVYSRPCLGGVSGILGGTPRGSFLPVEENSEPKKLQELSPNFVGGKVVFLNPWTYSAGELCFADVFISVVGHVVFQ